MTTVDLELARCICRPGCKLTGIFLNGHRLTPTKHSGSWKTQDSVAVEFSEVCKAIGLKSVEESLGLKEAEERLRGKG